MIIKPETKFCTHPYSAIEDIQHKDTWKGKKMWSNPYKDDYM